MNKTLLASFFILVFAFLITAPTVVSVLEDSYDVSIFFGVNEEENNEKDSNKTLEIVVLETNKNVASLLFNEETKNISYYNKSYKPHKTENISPPPEQHLL